MILSDNRQKTDGGFTLVELMIASLVMAIIFMGLISSITGSIMATNMAKKAAEGQATARRLLEEATELDYGDMLLLDGSSLITADGVAAKYQVYETSSGLLTLEVEVCRPETQISLAQLSAMTMDDFSELKEVAGSRLRFTTMSTGMMPRAQVTNQTDIPDEVEAYVVD